MLLLIFIICEVGKYIFKSISTPTYAYARTMNTYENMYRLSNNYNNLLFRNAMRKCLLTPQSCAYHKGLHIIANTYYPEIVCIDMHYIVTSYYNIIVRVVHSDVLLCATE